MVRHVSAHASRSGRRCRSVGGEAGRRSTSMLTNRPPRRALAIVEKIRLNRLMDCPPPGATSHALAFIGGTFYISGGAIVTVAAMLGPGLRHRLVIELTGAAAIAMGIL